MSNRTAVTPQLTIETPATINSGSGFFSQYAPSALLSNALYAQNTAAQLYTMNTLQLRADFKPLSVRELFSGASYSYKPSVSARPNTILLSMSKLAHLASRDSFFSKSELGGVLFGTPRTLATISSFSSEPRLAAWWSDL